ncbi:hypothetical protein GQ53DRAFT_835917 [Thozetella sp. PMI_491]|nr:hypothetical protein GQ53DRAFT_835917 [Thozetella sp. PMI_491]
MVFYGALSKGCQRCRQRKIKCDQRKPACLKCEKAKKPCPGFRNLTDIIFRDESERIIRIAHRDEAGLGDKEPIPLSSRRTSLISTKLPPATISYAPSQPLSDLAPSFFFTKYTSNEPPFSNAFQAWLTEMYLADCPGSALRVAIDAAGMAGISNVSYAPGIASRSQEYYVRALAAVKRSLSDPAASVADTTFITVLLLGLFEFINFENSSQYRSWNAHISGATALLQLRGQGQLDNERGRQFLMMLRSQVLYACLQHDLVIPGVVIDLNHHVEASGMGEMCIRLARLRAEMKTGKATRQAIRDAAVEMNYDLEAWKADRSSDWQYVVADVDERAPGTYFQGKRHIYSNPWTARRWNNWRTLRLLVNRIILDNCLPSDPYESGASSVIRLMSTDICISGPCFMDSPRGVGLIWPLSVVSQECLSPISERSWAAELLHRIGTSLGIRRASSLADAMFNDMNANIEWLLDV